MKSRVWRPHTHWVSSEGAPSEKRKTFLGNAVLQWDTINRRGQYYLIISRINSCFKGQQQHATDCKKPCNSFNCDRQTTHITTDTADCLQPHTIQLHVTTDTADGLQPHTIQLHITTDTADCLQPHTIQLHVTTDTADCLQPQTIQLHLNAGWLCLWPIEKLAFLTNNGGERSPNRCWNSGCLKKGMTLIILDAAIRHW